MVDGVLFLSHEAKGKEILGSLFSMFIPVKRLSIPFSMAEIMGRRLP
jgi:hypothetical protein